MKALGHTQVTASLNRDEAPATVSGIGTHICISIHDAAFMGPFHGTFCDTAFN